MPNIDSSRTAANNGDDGFIHCTDLVRLMSADDTVTGPPQYFWPVTVAPTYYDPAITRLRPDTQDEWSFHDSDVRLLPREHAHRVILPPSSENTVVSGHPTYISCKEGTSYDAWRYPSSGGPGAPLRLQAQDSIITNLRLEPQACKHTVRPVDAAADDDAGNAKPKPEPQSADCGPECSGVYRATWSVPKSLFTQNKEEQQALSDATAARDEREEKREQMTNGTYGFVKRPTKAYPGSEMVGTIETVNDTQVSTSRWSRGRASKDSIVQPFYPTRHRVEDATVYVGYQTTDTKGEGTKIPILALLRDGPNQEVLAQFTDQPAKRGDELGKEATSNPERQVQVSAQIFTAPSVEGSPGTWSSATGRFGVTLDPRPDKDIEDAVWRDLTAATSSANDTYDLSSKGKDTEMGSVQHHELITNKGLTLTLRPATDIKRLRFVADSSAKKTSDQPLYSFGRQSVGDGSEIGVWTVLNLNRPPSAADPDPSSADPSPHRMFGKMRSRWKNWTSTGDGK